MPFIKAQTSENIAGTPSQLFPLGSPARAYLKNTILAHVLRHPDSRNLPQLLVRIHDHEKILILSKLRQRPQNPETQHLRPHKIAGLAFAPWR